MLLCRSAPPQITTLLLPVASSLHARSTAASDDAHAASTVKLEPPRSRRLAMRPEMTFDRMPGNESSVSRGSTASSAGGSGPASCRYIARKP